MVAGVDPQRTLRALLDVYTETGLVIDSGGRILEIVDCSQESPLFDVDSDRLQNRQLQDVLPATTADRFLDTIQTTLTEETAQTIEYECDGNGGRRWFEASVTPLRPLEEPPEAVVWAARDVTDRKARQHHLESQNAKIEALHDIATDIETCETPDAVYELVVEAAESILEFDIAIADEAQGDVLVPQAVSSDVSADQYYETTPIDADDNFAAEAFRTGESSLVADLRTHDVAPADSVFRSALTVPIGDYGVFQSVAETPDVFDERDLELVEMLVAHARARLVQFEREQQLQKQTRQLQRQNERLDEFASIVSHDLRTPLSIAKGNLDLARRETTSEYHEQVDAALDRMEELIDDLLALARYGEQVGELESIALADVVELCWDPVAPAEATLAVETDQTIRADRERLQQLLENLLTNAIEHGGDDVTVTVGNLTDDSGFYVADDGPGIPPDEREQVFESGYSTATDGTGFGLSIVRELADAHGWSVEITDSEDGGARFDVRNVEVADG